MNSKRIAITGAHGVIGAFLVAELSHHGYEITQLVRASTDINNYDGLVQALAGHVTVIHLAWNSRAEDVNSGQADQDNTRMFSNVYRAALEAKVKRVIMASSVHAHGFYNVTPGNLIHPYDLPTPDSPYGASKVHMEALGRFYATKGLEVICIRFGAFGRQNIPPVVTRRNNPIEKIKRAVWLSRDDCVGLVRKCLEAPSLPNNYELLYGISNNSGRVHDITNHIGWVPHDDANEF